MSHTYPQKIQHLPSLKILCPPTENQKAVIRVRAQRSGGRKPEPVRVALTPRKNPTVPLGKRRKAAKFGLQDMTHRFERGPQKGVLVLLPGFSEFSGLGSSRNSLTPETETLNSILRLGRSFVHLSGLSTL